MRIKPINSMVQFPKIDEKPKTKHRFYNKIRQLDANFVIINY